MGAKCNFNLDGSRNANVMKMRQNKSMAAISAQEMAKIQAAAAAAEAQARAATEAAAAEATAAAKVAGAGAGVEAAPARDDVSAMEVESNVLGQLNSSEQSIPVPPVSATPVVDVPAQLGQVSGGGWVQLSEDGADEAQAQAPSSSSSSSPTTAPVDVKEAPPAFGGKELGPNSGERGSRVLEPDDRRGLVGHSAS